MIVASCSAFLLVNVCPQPLLITPKGGRIVLCLLFGLVFHQYVHNRESYQPACRGLHIRDCKTSSSSSLSPLPPYPSLWYSWDHTAFISAEYLSVFVRTYISAASLMVCARQHCFLFLLLVSSTILDISTFLNLRYISGSIYESAMLLLLYDLQ